MDTALLLAGALFCQSYFDRDDPQEAEVRALAESLFARADWRWAQVRPPMLAHGWDPEEGFLPYDWRGMNESMLVPILALGSPTHAPGPEVWSDWERGCRWGTFQGIEHVGFAPLFGHQYPQVWLDLRGLQDSLMRAHGHRLVRELAPRHARAAGLRDREPGRLPGLRRARSGASPRATGRWTTRHGPRAPRGTPHLRGARRRRPATCATTARSRPRPPPAGSPSRPEVVVPVAARHARDLRREPVRRYGFVDALNPTLYAPVHVRAGRIVPRPWAGSTSTAWASTRGRSS